MEEKLKNIKKNISFIDLELPKILMMTRLKV